MFQLRNETIRPSPASVKLVNEIGGLIRPSCNNLSDWYDNYLRNHRLRVAFDIDLVSRYAPKGAKVLDVGCVPPLLTGALRRMGYDVCGVDISPERFQAALLLLDLVVQKCNIELEKLPFSDSSFDVILFNEIFEHLRINPIFTLGEVFRIMKPGARLLLSTPNLHSLEGLIRFLVHRQAISVGEGIFDEYSKLSRLGHMGHVREYTSREVCEFLCDMGFNIESIHYRGGYGSLTRKVASNLFLSLRPYFTVVAKKNELQLASAISANQHVEKTCYAS